MTPAKPRRARAAAALAAVGFSYIGYLFVLACIVLTEGIPDDADYSVGRVSANAKLFAFSSFWGLLPLAAVLVLILVLARTSRAPAESRLGYIFLIVGFPFAAVAYFIWYRLGW